MIYATRQYIQLITSALAKETGVEIREGNQWAANAQDNILVYDPNSLKYLPFTVVKGILLHEISHLLHSTTEIPAKKWSSKYNPKTLHGIYNAYEDIRIEYLMVEKYGQFAQKSLRTSLVYCIGLNLEQGIDTLSRLNQFLFYSIYKYHFLYETHNSYEDIVFLINSLTHNSFSPENIITPNGPFNIDKDVFDRYTLNDSAILDMLERIRVSSTTTQDVTDIIDNELIPLIEDFIEEDSQNQDQEDEENNKNEQEGSNQNTQQNKRIDISTLAEDKKQVQNRLIAGSRHAEDRKKIEKPTEQEAIALLNPYISTLTQRLQSILQEKAHTKWRGAYQSGKLLSKNAYKVIIPNETRVFSKKTIPDKPYYHVWLALDASGSMSEEQRGVYAYMGAILLREVMQKLQCKITIFQYDEEATEVHSLEHGYHWNGGGTDDDTALLLIEKGINKNEDNLIFFLTDGETNTSPERSERMAKLIHNKALIFGIGIGHDISRNVLERNYPHSVLVDEVQLLPEALLQVVRSIIKR